MVVKNLDLSPNRAKHRELLKHVDEIVDLYLNKNRTLREIGQQFGCDKGAIKRALLKQNITVIKANHRKSELTCVDCSKIFIGRRGSALRCSECRLLKRNLDAKQKYRDQFTEYNGAMRSCILCSNDITHHKLDRVFCDQCRPRDCSYLKYIRTLLEKCQFACTYCSIKICRQVPPTVDHIIPLSRGGTNDLENLTIACKSCNSRKGAKTFSEFQKEVISW